MKYLLLLLVLLVLMMMLVFGIDEMDTVILQIENMHDYHCSCLDLNKMYLYLPSSNPYINYTKILFDGGKF